MCKHPSPPSGLSAGPRTLFVYFCPRLWLSDGAVALNDTLAQSLVRGPASGRGKALVHCVSWLQLAAEGLSTVWSARPGLPTVNGVAHRPRRQGQDMSRQLSRRLGGLGRLGA